MRGIWSQLRLVPGYDAVSIGMSFFIGVIVGAVLLMLAYWVTTRGN